MSERTLFLACRNFLAKQKFGRWSKVIETILQHQPEWCDYTDRGGRGIFDSLFDMNSGFDDRSFHQDMALTTEHIDDLKECVKLLVNAVSTKKYGMLEASRQLLFEVFS